MGTMDLRDAIGLGVAGNFTWHLEQAGEASDFVDVEVADASAPKGVFPFYVPAVSAAGEHFLHAYPIVVVYDGRTCDEPRIRELISSGTVSGAPGISLLRQRVE
jgi:hypothetical protein